jgi:hypothetical protein
VARTPRDTEAASVEHPDLNVRNIAVRGVGHLSLPRNRSIAFAIAEVLPQLDLLEPHHLFTLSPDKIRPKPLSFRNLLVIFLKLSGLLRGSSQSGTRSRQTVGALVQAVFTVLDAGSGHGSIACQR